MVPLRRPRELRVRGYTLVETLVACAVLAIALLGSVALLLEGLRAGRSALYRTQAVTLAADLSERIRANRRAGPGYALEAGATASPLGSDCSKAGECTVADVAALDLHEWQQSAALTLPGVVTEVAVAPVGATASHIYAIKVRWTSPGTAEPESLVLTIRA